MPSGLVVGFVRGSFAIMLHREHGPFTALSCPYSHV
jgi:hypothetical protein